MSPGARRLLKWTLCSLLIHTPQAGPLMNMFCCQCEQTARESGCTAQGVCGKSPDVAEMQDLLIYAMRPAPNHLKEVP